MAPAVADTILAHFKDLNRPPDYYDFVVTGDLGAIGLQLVMEILKRNNLNITGQFTDCGVMIYSPEQDTHAGGSGCGCSAVVLSGNILDRVLKGELKKVLLIGSGCLHSTASSLQGETMPAIGHAVSIEAN